MGGRHVRLPETELRVRLFYAPTVTPPGQLVGPTRTCVKCQMVGAEVQPSVISARENRWPRALPRTPGLPVTPLRLLVSRRKHSSSHWAGLQDSPTERGRGPGDSVQAVPEKLSLRRRPCDVSWLFASPPRKAGCERRAQDAELRLARPHRAVL